MTDSGSCKTCRYFDSKDWDSETKNWCRYNDLPAIDEGLCGHYEPMIKPCPFCGSQNLTKYRFDIGGFLYKDGCTETICENGDTFRIECDCGCKFDKCQDELFDKAEGIYTCDGKYDVEITDEDMWNIMTTDWNRRVSE